MDITLVIDWSTRGGYGSWLAASQKDYRARHPGTDKSEAGSKPEGEVEVLMQWVCNRASMMNIAGTDIGWDQDNDNEMSKGTNLNTSAL